MASANDAKQSSAKAGPTSNTKLNRLPAPTLFVGPPSRNTSQLSLSQQVSTGALKPTKESLQRHKVALERDNNDKLKPTRDIPTFQLRRPSEKSIETKWREMQSTLNEVELTAQGSLHVFGQKHAAALEELRRAQIELARAWGRGNEEQNAATKQTTSIVASAAESPMEQRPTRKRGDTATSVSTQLSGESETSDSTAKSLRSHLEDDTAEDIRLANERRAANEAYFKKVDQSVKEVVSKLEAVAEAMKDVEGESRSLWDASSLSSV